MLLAPPPPAELPGEALLARLRARRAALGRPGFDDAGPTPEELLAWLHPRLEGRLRRALRPCLELEAMHYLLLALRHRLGGVTVPPGLLHQPWLAPELAALMARPGDAAVLIAGLEAWLCRDYPFAAGLAQGYLDQGPGRVEQQLATGILRQSLAQAREPTVRLVIRFLIDLRNLLAVLRHWRWRLRSGPILLAGGELDPALLSRAWAAGDDTLVGRLASRLAGTPLPDLEPRTVERQLLGGLTRRLHQAGRDPLGGGVIVETLWRCQVAARNRALLRAAGREDGLLAAALL